jgi:hypothetical protein
VSGVDPNYEIVVLSPVEDPLLVDPKSLAARPLPGIKTPLESALDSIDLLKDEIATLKVSDEFFNIGQGILVIRRLDPTKVEEATDRKRTQRQLGIVAHSSNQIPQDTRTTTWVAVVRQNTVRVGRIQTRSA